MSDRAFEEWLWKRIAPVDAGHLTSCWDWRRSLRPDGYPQVCALRWTGHIKKVRAHRLTYERIVGPIPEGLTLDHLCRRPSCVNPAHLEPVTQSLNSARAHAARCEPGKLACGHERTPQNLVAKGKVLCCRSCHNRRQRAYNARLAAKRQDNVLRRKFARVRAT